MGILHHFSIPDLYFLILLFVFVHGLPDQGEPTCMSRYDYEHKMLHSVVTMEIEQAAQQERIEKLTKQLENENTVLTEKLQELEKTIVTQDNVIETMAASNQKSLTHCTGQCKPGDGMTYEGYTFKDYLAQATCMALGVGHMFAVRRTCSRSSPVCSAVCKTLGKTCVNSLHVYGRTTIATNDVGKAGLHIFRYNSCGGGCGPNYCCCQG